MCDPVAWALVASAAIGTGGNAAISNDSQKKQAGELGRAKLQAAKIAEEEKAENTRTAAMEMASQPKTPAPNAVQIEQQGAKAISSGARKRSPIMKSNASTTGFGVQIR